MTRLLLFAALVSISWPGAAQDQKPAPVGGTIAYQALSYEDLYPTRRSSGGLRFMGRINVPVHSVIRVGFAVGSWSRHTYPEEGGASPGLDLVEWLSEAVLAQAYVQYFPAGTHRLVFLRGGAGHVRADTYRPGISAIEHARSHHLALTIGAGADIPLSGVLFVTPAVDYARIGRTTEDRHFGVIRRALSVGIGLTIR